MRLENCSSRMKMERRFLAMCRGIVFHFRLRQDQTIIAAIACNKNVRESRYQSIRDWEVEDITNCLEIEWSFENNGGRTFQSASRV